jgi:hypothetical protein
MGVTARSLTPCVLCPPSHCVSFMGSQNRSKLPSRPSPCRRNSFLSQPSGFTVPMGSAVKASGSKYAAILSVNEQDN